MTRRQDKSVEWRMADGSASVRMVLILYRYLYRYSNALCVRTSESTRTVLISMSVVYGIKYTSWYDILQCNMTDPIDAQRTNLWFLVWTTDNRQRVTVWCDFGSVVPYCHVTIMYGVFLYQISVSIV